MNIYLKLIWAYLKIGIFGFGGGYAMLSLVEKAVVEPGWISGLRSPTLWPSRR